MVCLTIHHKNLDDIIALLDSGTVEMAEIRLDLCPLSDNDIEYLFSGSDIPLVATARISQTGSSAITERLLSTAIRSGAKYVDLEIEAPPATGKRIRHLAKESGTILIRSYHNFNETPPREELEEILHRCKRFGGEVVKLAVTAVGPGDTAVVASLYDASKEGWLVAFCMGEAGISSRIDCLKWGAPFTYACLNEKERLCPGQPTLESFGILKEYSFRKDGIKMPASKSFAQRAIIAAALSEGVSRLHGYTPCDDSEAALNAARMLGARVQKGKNLEITGIGPIEKPLDIKKISAGESGLLARLLIPVISCICSTPVTVSGEKTLLRRPLSDANDIMASYGVVLSGTGRGSKKDVYLPVEIAGKLISGRSDISGRGGSQLISGLLMALPLVKKNSTIFLHDPKSIPYMFITMDVLRKFGINISNEMEGDDEFLETQNWSLCTGMTFKIKGEQPYKAAEFDIEADWSSAAFFLVAGAVFGRTSIRGLDTTSLQADITVMDILVDAGASVSQDEDGTINVYKSPLNPFESDLNNSPDLFPIIAILACFCPGTSRISGMGRLVNKETDRAAAILEMLRSFGVTASKQDDDLLIEGHSLSQRILSGNLLHGGKISSHHDHRMAMALKVASLGADQEIEIDDMECISKSFPDFVRIFDNQ